MLEADICPHWPTDQMRKVMATECRPYSLACKFLDVMLHYRAGVLGQRGLATPVCLMLNTNSNSKHEEGYFEKRRLQCVFKMCLSMIENGIGIKCLSKLVSLIRALIFVEFCLFYVDNH